MTNRRESHTDSRAGNVSRIATRIVLVFFLAGIHDSAIIAAPNQAVRVPKGVAQLPEGAAKLVIVAKCQFCHTLERVVAARMPKDGWEESVYRMADLGTPLTSEEIPILIDYLSENFGPAGPKPTNPVAGSAASASAASAASPNPIVDPDRAAFSPVPESMGAAKGAEMFIISGDPSNPGPYSALVKFSAGGIVPAGWLSSANHVLSLRGIFQYGAEGSTEESNLQILKPGTVIHAASQSQRLRGRAYEGTILLIYGEGPLSATGK